MTVQNTFDKDPVSKLDFGIKWSDFLDTDQITGSSWAAVSSNPAGMIIETTSFTTGTTTAWLSSGTAFNTYRFENTIGTLGGREANRSILVTVKDK